MSDEGARLHTNPCFWSSKIVWATNLEINKNIDVIIIPNYLNLLELIVEFLNDPQKSIQIFLRFFSTTQNTIFFFKQKPSDKAVTQRSKSSKAIFADLSNFSTPSESLLIRRFLGHNWVTNFLMKSYKCPIAIIVTTFHLKQKPLELKQCNLCHYATLSHVHQARHQLLHKLRGLLAHSIQENIEDKVPDMTDALDGNELEKLYKFQGRTKSIPNMPYQMSNIYTTYIAWHDITSNVIARIFQETFFLVPVILI